MNPFTTKPTTGGSPPPVRNPLVPLVFDLETTNPSPKEIEIERRFAATGNCKKAETIAAKQNGVKLATTESAPIWCVGLFSTGGFLNLSQAVLSEADRLYLSALGIQAYTYPNEAALLAAYASVLATLPTETALIAAGCFDLHKSRFRFARQRPPVPAPLWFLPHTDLMMEWQKFTTSPKPKDAAFISVEEMSLKLGLGYDNVMTGEEVPGAIAEGRYVDVILKNYKDCQQEWGIARCLLSGRFAF